MSVDAWPMMEPQAIHRLPWRKATVRLQSCEAVRCEPGPFGRWSLPDQEFGRRKTDRVATGLHRHAGAKCGELPKRVFRQECGDDDRPLIYVQRLVGEVRLETGSDGVGDAQRRDA